MRTPFIPILLGILCLVLPTELWATYVVPDSEPPHCDRVDPANWTGPCNPEPTVVPTEATFTSPSISLDDDALQEIVSQIKPMCIRDEMLWEGPCKDLSGHGGVDVSAPDPGTSSEPPGNSDDSDGGDDSGDGDDSGGKGNNGVGNGGEASQGETDSGATGQAGQAEGDPSNPGRGGGHGRNGGGNSGNGGGQGGGSQK